VCRRALVSLVLVLSVSGCGDGGTQAHPFDDTVSAAPSGKPSAGEGQPGQPQTFLTIDDSRVAESSGLARSNRHPGVLYTHNDAGSAPEVFAIDASGTRAVLTLDVPATDWEDIASTPDGRLWIGDIGDNRGIRSSVSVSVVEEPVVLASTAVTSTTYRFSYPDGAHDAEALLVHPRTGRLYLVTKGEDEGTVYAAPAELSTDGVNLLQAVGEAPLNITGGDIAPDGSPLVLRNQGRAFFYPALGEPATEVTLPEQPQGESIVFDQDGTHVLVGSEGARSTVLQVPVPAGLGTDP
jgi:hypothetical protein